MLPAGPEPSAQSVVTAVMSLCHDQLRPYGRILKKRIEELAEASGGLTPDVTLVRLRALCEQCGSLRVVAEGEVDWSAEPLAGAPAGFVDIYDTHDDYDEELWSELAAWLENCDDEISAPGGRYVYAQELMSRNLQFLAGYTLGYVSHIVQLGMTQRRLLGYRNGAIVPYAASQTMMKQQCAENQQSCRRTKLRTATWEILRTCLRELLDVDGLSWSYDVGIPLSNVKRTLRARFRVDMSETALGYAAASDLFKDARLQDICTLRLHEKGYVLIRESGAATGGATGEFCSASTRYPPGPVHAPSAYSPPRRQTRPPIFSTSPVPLVSSCGAERHDWDIARGGLGIPSPLGHSGAVAPGQVDAQELLRRNTFEFHTKPNRVLSTEPMLMTLPRAQAMACEENWAQTNLAPVFDDLQGGTPSPSAFVGDHGFRGMFFNACGEVFPPPPLAPTEDCHSQGIPPPPQAPGDAGDDDRWLEPELHFVGNRDNSTMPPAPGPAPAGDGSNRSVFAHNGSLSSRADEASKPTESTSGDYSAYSDSDDECLPVTPRESQVFASTPSEDCSPSFSVLLQASVQVENEGASNVPLHFLDGGGFALQDVPLCHPADGNASTFVARTLLSGRAHDGKVAKVVNTFITILPCDVLRSAESRRCRARSEEPCRATHT